MTNRQWLLNEMQNMSDEELVETLEKIVNECQYENTNYPCDSDCIPCKALWLKSEHKEQIKLSDAERVILENVDKEYKWIARDKNGYLKASKDKPEKECVTWERCHGYISMGAFNHLFQFIKWEDENPYSIEELLKQN